MQVKMIKTHGGLYEGSTRNVSQVLGTQLVGMGCAEVHIPFSHKKSIAETERIRKAYTAAEKKTAKKAAPKPAEEAPAKTEKAGDVLEKK